MATWKEEQVADGPSAYEILAAAQEADARRAEEYRQSLLAEYGPDRFRRGDVLIFRPHQEDADQETRVAVKIGPGQWTLTARGSSRTWIETLVLAGTGHLLVKCSNEIPAKPVISIAAAT